MEHTENKQRGVLSIIILNAKLAEHQWDFIELIVRTIQDRKKYSVMVALESGDFNKGTLTEQAANRIAEEVLKALPSKHRTSESKQSIVGYLTRF